MCAFLCVLWVWEQSKRTNEEGQVGFVLGGFLIEPSQGKRGNSSAWQIYKKK